MYSRAHNHYGDIMTESRLATYHNVCGKFLMKLNLCEKLWSHVKIFFILLYMLSILLAKGLLDSRLTCHLIDNNFLFLTINYIPLINSTFLILYLILCYYLILLIDYRVTLMLAKALLVELGMITYLY